MISAAVISAATMDPPRQAAATAVVPVIVSAG